jgi:hypothetical protein
MINLKTFTLGSTEVTIERYTGSNTNGIYTRTLDTTITTWASVQPYSTVEEDIIFNPATGEYVDEIRQMYTTEKVYVNDRDSSNPFTDLIVVEGEKWKPTKVEAWQHLNQKHYVVLLQKFDGF